MAYSVCKGITRRAAKNFYYAFLVLPRRKREALCAIYAFMRRCDDIADDPTLTLPDRRQKLEAWLDALHRVQQGQPTDDAILLALTDAQLVNDGVTPSMLVDSACNNQYCNCCQFVSPASVPIYIKNVHANAAPGPRIQQVGEAIKVFADLSTFFN